MLSACESQGEISLLTVAFVQAAAMFEVELLPLDDLGT